MLLLSGSVSAPQSLWSTVILHIGALLDIKWALTMMPFGSGAETKLLRDTLC